MSTPSSHQAGSSLEGKVCALVPHSLQEEAVCCSLFSQDYSCCLVQICWPARQRILLPPFMLCTSVWAMGGETLVESPRAVGPFSGTAKMRHRLAKNRKKPQNLQLSFWKDVAASFICHALLEWMTYWYCLYVCTTGRRNWSRAVRWCLLLIFTKRPYNYVLTVLISKKYFSNLFKTCKTS